MSFPRYPKYKDSSVEWLGQVPEHWEIRRLRQIGRMLKGSGGSKEDAADAGVPCVRYGDLYTTHAYFIRKARTYVTEDRSADYLAIRHGDVLFAASGEDLAEIGRSAAVLFDERACCGGDLVVLRPEIPTVPEFMGYACDCLSAKAQKASMGRGTTIKHIYPDQLKQILLTVPPRPEQATIAAFLDRETDKIDALIAEQQRLIELLHEKRQAVISQAVTKGLSSQVPMKDTGVAWLGLVPSHWRVLPLKRIVSTPITDGPHETPELFPTGVPFVSAEAVSSGIVDFTKIRGFISEEDNARYSRKYSPQLNDIYMVKSGATTGVTAIVDGSTDFNIWSPLAVIRCGPEADPFFLLNFMRGRSFLDGVVLNWSYGTQQNIGMGVIENLPCVLPPRPEQAEIVAQLDMLRDAISPLVAKAEGAIKSLVERRAVLINAAVTGKIDVRKEAA